MRTLCFVKILISILCLTMWSSCQNDRDVFELKYPGYFPEPHYSFEGNPLSKEKFELGRKLFHDPILSVDSTISCASCHAQVHAFADHNTALSTGVFNRLGTRNSPAIFNMAWQTSFMWDGGINHIEVMPLGPITNKLEMAEDMANVVHKINRNPGYVKLFEKAFGEGPVNSQKVFFALAQYMSMLVSADSKYDKMRQGKARFTPEESEGYALFQSKCAGCHTEPLFTDNSFRNNGLLPDPDDTGRGLITLDPADLYTFKVPSLRNVALTYPYMHDGSLRNLKEVLDHYDAGIVVHENTDPLLVQSGQKGIRMSEKEKSAMLAFLHTLTDYTFISNPLYSE